MAIERWLGPAERAQAPICFCRLFPACLPRLLLQRRKASPCRASRTALNRQAFDQICKCRRDLGCARRFPLVPRPASISPLLPKTSPGVGAQPFSTPQSSLTADNNSGSCIQQYAETEENGSDKIRQIRSMDVEGCKHLLPSANPPTPPQSRHPSPLHDPPATPPAGTAHAPVPGSAPLDSLCSTGRLPDNPSKTESLVPA
jgi:hypothetical protein